MKQIKKPYPRWFSILLVSIVALAGVGSGMSASAFGQAEQSVQAEIESRQLVGVGGVTFHVKYRFHEALYSKSIFILGVPKSFESKNTLMMMVSESDPNTAYVSEVDYDQKEKAWSSCIQLLLVALGLGIYFKYLESRSVK